MKNAAFIFLLLLMTQAAEAQCSKELLSAEDAEKGSWSMNFGISGEIGNVLNGMRGSADINNAATRIKCILVDAEMPRSIQYTFLSSAVGKINLSNARDHHIRAVASALASYGASLADIGRKHDADSVSILVFNEQPKVLPAYLSSLQQHGIQVYTNDNLPKLVRARKLEDYHENVAKTDGQVAKLLEDRYRRPPNIDVLLSALEKEEDRALRFLRKDRLEAVSLFVGDWNNPMQELKIVNGQPKNIISFQDWSGYARAAAKFEGRDVNHTEKFTIQCQFAPEALVNYGEQTETWKVSFVSYQERNLIFECSQT